MELESSAAQPGSQPEPAPTTAGSARASPNHMSGSVLVQAPSGSGALLPILEHKQYANEPAEPPVPLAAPVSTHSTASRVIKGEDVMYVHPLAIATTPPSMLYMVCDGHSGSEAATYVAANFLRILNSKLPTKMPSVASPKELETFAELVRRAVCETFIRLDNDWIAVGHMAGTTVSAVIVVGYLLTTANVGDSSAVLDTGCSILELTGSHRIHNNVEEQARLRAAGCQLAPLGFHLQGPARPNELGVGPLRLWPGGLCVSRSVGDLDAGPEVMPLPNIRQVVLPQEGSRLMVCSDGVWDLMNLSKAVKLCRLKTAAGATDTLMAAVSRDMRLLDDASIIVVDFLPSEGTSFPTVALRSNPKPEKSGGLFACFKPELEEPDSRDLSGGQPGHLGFMADVDALKAYPHLRHALQRTQIQYMASLFGAGGALAGGGPGGRPGAPVDYTMHGASKVWAETQMPTHGANLQYAWVSLYKYDEQAPRHGNGRPRSNSSPAVADVAADPANHSNHSDAALQFIGAGGGSMGPQAVEMYEPVVSFGGSAPGGHRTSSTSLLNS